MQHYYSESGRFVKASSFNEARRKLLLSHPKLQEILENEKETIEGLLEVLQSDEEEARLEGLYGDILKVRSEKEQYWEWKSQCLLFLCWNPEMDESKPDQVALVLATTLHEALAACAPRWTGKQVQPPKGTCPWGAFNTPAYYWPGVREPHVSFHPDPDSCGGGWDFCKRVLAVALYRPKKAGIFYVPPADTEPPSIVPPRTRREPLEPGQVAMTIDRAWLGVYWKEGPRPAQVEWQVKVGGERGVYWQLPDRLNPPKGG